MNVSKHDTIKKLNLEQLSKLCVGEDFWHSHPIPEYDIPSMMLSDGPHGLRKQSEKADHLGVNDSITAICFPSASSVASSFDKDMAYEMGRLLGMEARAEGVHILLGPAINLKRTPLCGRNFEYFSEDPFLTGELAAELVRGIESTGVGACVKHYVANNQENCRMTLSAEIDERTLREIYLKAFERVIKESPTAVMSSYNRVNGEYVGESTRLLTDILRKEWGFKGIVISDWYAVNDRVKAILAGLDLEMPGGPLASSKKLETFASKDDKVKAAVIESATRIVNTAKRLCVERTEAYSLEEHHDKAVQFACECAVLLKNDDILPLKENEKILLVGKLAKIPRFQGGGSSHINSYYVDSVLDYLDNADFFDFEQETDFTIQKFKEKLEKYDKIVVFADIPDEYESEGYDRESLALPEKTNQTIEFLASSGVNTIVVLCTGSPVTMPWIDKVGAVLLMGLCGEGSGKACAQLLVGAANPSGRLAESYPLSLEHTPGYINSRGDQTIHYAEGVFIGYRYYSTKKLPTLFPFGHGLSYTKFHYDNLVVNQIDEQLNISITVKNIGQKDGKETVQLYIAPPQKGIVNRPSIELKGFQKIFLEVGEESNVTFLLERKDLCYFDLETNDFQVEDGSYRVIIGRSAEEEICSVEVNITGDAIPPLINDNVTIGQLLRYPPTAQLISSLISGYSTKNESDAIGEQMVQSMLINAPLRLVKGIAKLEEDKYQELLDALRVLTVQTK